MATPVIAAFGLIAHPVMLIVPCTGPVRGPGISMKAMVPVLELELETVKDAAFERRVPAALATVTSNVWWPLASGAVSRLKSHPTLGHPGAAVAAEQTSGRFPP